MTYSDVVIGWYGYGGAYAHIQLVFRQYGIRDVGSADVKNKSTRCFLIERFSEPDICQSIKTDLDVIDAMSPFIDDLEKRIEGQSIYHNPRDYRLLLTVPGVGPMIALNILYETHVIGRFRKVQDFSSYCRVRSGESQSPDSAQVCGGGLLDVETQPGV